MFGGDANSIPCAPVRRGIGLARRASNTDERPSRLDRVRGGVPVGMRSRGSARRALEAISRSEQCLRSAPAFANEDADRPEMRATSVYHRHPCRDGHPFDRTATRTPHGAVMPQRLRARGANECTACFTAPRTLPGRDGLVDRRGMRSSVARSGVFFPNRGREADPSDAPSFDARCAPTAELSGWSRRLRRTEIAAALPRVNA